MFSLSSQRARIIGAVTVALLLVGGAYVLSGPSLFSLNFVGAESNEELLRAYAAKDTDRDGLPDWQEELYGTDPSVADTDGDGVSDGDAARNGTLTTQRIITDTTAQSFDVESIPGTTPAPGTLTEEFSRSFFEVYMSSWNGTPLSAEEQNALTQKLLGEFATKASARLDSKYTLSSVRVADVTLTEYIGNVERIVRANDVEQGGENPVLLAEAFIENDDRSALPKLERLAGAYKNMATALAATSVPQYLSDEHLTLIRSLDTLANSTEAVAGYEGDPLAVLGALALLQPAATSFMAVFYTYADEIMATNPPQAGGVGSMIVNVANTTRI